MAGTISHRFESPVADAGDPTEVGPDEWNDSLVVAGGNDGDAMVRRTAETDGWRLERRGAPLSQVSTTTAANAGAGETNLHSQTIAASHFETNGKMVTLRGGGSLAANATPKNIEFKFGTETDITLNGVTAAPNGVDWAYEIQIIRSGVDTQRLHIKCWVGVVFEKNDSLTAAQDDGATIVCQFKGTAGANNDIVQEWSAISYDN